MIASQNQMEMVRTGIGLYGVSNDKNLQQICRLESAISQIRNIKKGEKIGYRNAFEAPHDMRIAVIPVGYADGLNRKLGDGKGKAEYGGRAQKLHADDFAGATKEFVHDYA